MNRFELNYSNSEFYERHKGDEKALTNKWADAIRNHNDSIADEIDKSDLIGPFELWEMVMSSKKSV